MWNFWEQLIYRTAPLTASAFNFTLYFQVVNSGSTIWTPELLFTWIDISCSFILQFYFRIFFFTRGDFNFDWLFFIKLIWWNRARPIFSKFDQTKMRQILLYTLSNLFDSINLIKLIWPCISGFTYRSTPTAAIMHQVSYLLGTSYYWCWVEQKISFRHWPKQSIARFTLAKTKAEKPDIQFLQYT